VLIIGLRGEQISRTKRDFGNEFVLDFVDSEKTESATTVAAAAQYADTVIAMTKFISHAALKAIRNHAGYMPVYGAVTKAREALQQLKLEATT
jgi:precorrin-4 methylase